MPPEQQPTPDFILGQIDAKVSNLLENFRVQREDVRLIIDDIHKRIDGQNARLTRVEHSYWRIAGIASIVPLGLTVLGMLLAYINKA